MKKKASWLLLILNLSNSNLFAQAIRLPEKFAWSSTDIRTIIQNVNQYLRSREEIISLFSEPAECLICYQTENLHRNTCTRPGCEQPICQNCLQLLVNHVQNHVSIVSCPHCRQPLNIQELIHQFSLTPRTTDTVRSARNLDWFPTIEPTPTQPSEPAGGVMISRGYISTSPPPDVMYNGVLFSAHDIMGLHETGATQRLDDSNS